MKLLKKALAMLLSVSLISIPMLQIRAKAATAREVEYLGRGGYGIAVDGGVYLSWRLLGTEPIDLTFDIYRNDEIVKENIDATNYTDTEGKAGDIYRVVPHNGEGLTNDEFSALSEDYFDIILDKPETNPEDDFTYEFNDAAVGDVDNDGEYEFIIKWDPTNRQDNSVKGYTGNVLIDCYKQDGEKLWRIDLGKNIRAGSHYTQIIVYDFDGDGKAEMALRTAPGSKDGTGEYVSAAEQPIEIDGMLEPLTWEDSYTHEVFDDESDMRSDKGGTIGKILKGPDWLTMFDGATGKALATVNYYPQRGNVSSWGDTYANRSERYNAGVAYLDGEHPSLFTARGYYMRAAMTAYNWDGHEFTMLWHRDDTGNSSGSNKMNGTLYGNGNHQISVCDADNDGKDEIVFGSTVVDDDGNILNSTDHGHGDALHASDFNNDGKQEIFQVHEEASVYKTYGAEVRQAKDGKILGKVGATADVGRGLMGNFDDSINDESEFFSSADKSAYNMSGTKLGDAPANINPSFLIWWDGDLEREILTKTDILKYNISTKTKTTVKSFPQVHSGDKDAPALSADLFGDWREEVCYATEDNSTLRVYMTTTPTDYKIPTLLHDTQYREAIAWQNVGYNQPPHPKFYVGKAAASGNYLSPATGFDTVVMTGVTPDIKKAEQKDIPADTFTVTISAMGDINKTFSTYTGVKYGNSLSYTYPKYIIEDGIAYEAAAGSTSSTTHYGGSVAHVIKNQDIKINYTKAYGGVVYFKDFDESAGRNADIRASNGKAKSSADDFTTDYKLKPGKKYKIVLYYYNAGNGSKLTAGDTTLLDIANGGKVPARNWGYHIITDVTVEEETPVSIVNTDGKFDSFDTVLILNETLPLNETTPLNPLNEASALTVTGETSKTSTSVILPGKTGDTGSSQPTGYLTYTADADGVLSLTFKSSATKNSSNKPRLYYCVDDFSNANKNNADMIVEASGANSPISAQLNVTEGNTYYIFGYLYNMSSSFNYTLSDIKFTADEIKKYPVRFVNYDGTVFQEQMVSVNAMPDSYSGTTPKRSDDLLYINYTFSGWDKELCEVTGDMVYTAQFDGTPTGLTTEYLEPIGEFKDEIQIEKAIDDGGNAILMASKKNGSELEKMPDLTLYIAYYDGYGTVKGIKSLKLQEGKTVTVTKPASDENYKIMIWTDKYTPVVDVITKNSANKLF